MWARLLSRLLYLRIYCVCVDQALIFFLTSSTVWVIMQVAWRQSGCLKLAIPRSVRSSQTEPCSHPPPPLGHVALGNYLTSLCLSFSSMRITAPALYAYHNAWIVLGSTGWINVCFLHYLYTICPRIFKHTHQLCLFSRPTPEVKQQR